MLINQYLDDLITSKSLLKDELRAVKHDQSNIIKEINKIKSELDNLIDSFEMIIKKLGITLEIPSKVVFPRLS